VINSDNIKTINFIYGAGAYGRKMLSLSRTIGINIESFVQTKVETDRCIDGISLFVNC